MAWIIPNTEKTPIQRNHKMASAIFGFYNADGGMDAVCVHTP